MTETTTTEHVGYTGDRFCDATVKPGTRVDPEQVACGVVIRGDGGCGRTVDHLDDDAPHRFVAYANESFADERGRYFVAVVEENEPGYWRTTYEYGTAKESMDCADRINRARGYDQGDVLDVVASSMRVSNVG